MSNLFFNMHGTLEEVSVKLFSSIGISNYLEGDSANVLGGSYFDHSVFGLNIKLELNSYDYEDEYRFMLSITKNYLSKLYFEPKIELNVVEVIRIMIIANLSIEVAQQTPEGLKKYNSNQA